MHYVAPDYFSLFARKGTQFRPSRASDLDFFFWGHRKNLVYTLMESQQLRSIIIASCKSIRDIAVIFQRVRQSMSRRGEVYIEIGGTHFQQLLQL